MDSLNLLEQFKMSVLLQRLFIIILNPVYKLTGRMSLHSRTILVQAICFAIPVLYLCIYSGVLNRIGMGSLHERMIIGTILLVALIIISINSPLHEVAWRKTLFIPLVLCGLGLIVTGLHHSIGEGFMLFGFQLVFVFPCLALVWNNRMDYAVLFDALARGFVFVGILYFFLSLILAATGHFVMIGQRWAGTMENVNSLGFFGVHVFIASLYMILRQSGKYVQVVYSSAAGIGVGFMLLSGSRVSFLDCLVSCAAVAIYIIVRRKTLVSALTKTILFRYCLTVLLFSVLISTVLLCIPMLNASHDQRVSEGNNSTQSEAPVSITDRLNVKNSGGLNSYSSGRIELWKAYVKRLNLIGHDYDKTDWNQIDGGLKIGAHNLFLGVAYRCGVPVALVFVFLEIAAGLLAIMLLFDRKCSNQAYLFFILFVIEYGIDSSLDVAVAPFSRAPVLFFYIGMVCVMQKKPTLMSKETIQTNVL